MPSHTAKERAKRSGRKSRNIGKVNRGSSIARLRRAARKVKRNKKAS